MMGNVAEWVETPFNDPAYGAATGRGMRGGGWSDSATTIYEWITKRRLDGAFRKRGKHLLIAPWTFYSMEPNGNRE